MRIQTGSIPIVVETEPDADAAPERSGGRTAQAAPAAAATAPEQSGARHAAAQQPATAATGTVEEPPAETQEGRP
ncbi:Uncharacterised protein [Mycobacteroides abscessus subsp. abscessus]|nr:Uncharacterised protein [Mycobacteroides abscessus subsp. abscessus]